MNRTKRVKRKSSMRNAKTKSKVTAHGKEYVKPPKWNYSRIKQGYELALLGMTDVEIATEMDIDRSTLNAWKVKHPLFYEALKEGKTDADAKVVNALYKNAIGYETYEVVVHNNKVKEFNEFGKVIKEYYESKLVKVPKRVLPETKAQIKWLSARQPETWANEKHVKVRNQLNISIQNNAIDFSEISNDELEVIKKLGLMQDNSKTEDGEAEVIE